MLSSRKDSVPLFQFLGGGILTKTYSLCIDAYWGSLRWFTYAYMQLMSVHFISNLGWGNTHKNFLFSQSLILIYFRLTCSWLIWITIHGQFCRSFKKKNIVFWQFPMRIKILYLIMFIQDFTMGSLNKFLLTLCCAILCTIFTKISPTHGKIANKPWADVTYFLH